jgi:sigma-B regulation protein RsbU (phosphoserine phosphatase)
MHSTLTPEVQAQIAMLVRSGAPRIVIGIIIGTVGLLALILHFLRKRSKDPALLWFALFSILYGVRLLAQTRLVVIGADLSGSSQDYLISAITFIINPFASLFIYEIFPLWRYFLRWIVLAQFILAAAGLACDWLFYPYYLGSLNNVVVIGVVLLLDVLLFRIKPSFETNLLRAGFLLFSATILAANIGGLLSRRFDFELFGFAVYLGCLGVVLLHRATRSQERLTAIEEELSIARRIQTSILPTEIPRSPSFAVATRYIPMAAVAGDLYDLLIVDQDRLGILVADVTGHGVPAALIASMVKIAATAQAPHAEDPAQVLGGLNRILCPNTQGQFVTAAYLFFDFRTANFRYAAAAHPRMQWLRRATGNVEAVEQNGLLMGVMPSAAYTARESVFQTGDRFLLYTDGLIEAANERDEFFGEERVRQALHNSKGLGAEQAADYLLDQLSNWAGYNRGSSPADDLTLVVLDVLSATQR